MAIFLILSMAGLKVMQDRLYYLADSRCKWLNKFSKSVHVYSVDFVSRDYGWNNTSKVLFGKVSKLRKRREGTRTLFLVFCDSCLRLGQRNLFRQKLIKSQCILHIEHIFKDQDIVHILYMVFEFFLWN